VHRFRAEDFKYYFKFSRSGFFLKKDGFKMIFQTATPIFLSRGTIYKQGDFVLEKKIFAMLVNYTTNRRYCSRF
jgi:hypothetical protein